MQNSFRTSAALSSAEKRPAPVAWWGEYFHSGTVGEKGRLEFRYDLDFTYKCVLMYNRLQTGDVVAVFLGDDHRNKNLPDVCANGGQG